MLKLIAAIVMLALAVFVVVFTFHNNGAVTLDMWPTDLLAGTPVPLFAVVLVAGFVGFLVGALVTWLAGSGARGKAKQMSGRATSAERERDTLRETVFRLEAEARKRDANLPAPVQADAA